MTSMRTMPRPTLWFIRLMALAMAGAVRRWEDKHGDVRDYRMQHLATGLWQAADSVRQIRDGEFNPMHTEQTVGEPGRWMGEEISLDDDRAYVREFLNGRVIPRFPQQREGG